MGWARSAAARLKTLVFLVATQDPPGTQLLAHLRAAHAPRRSDVYGGHPDGPAEPPGHRPGSAPAYVRVQLRVLLETPGRHVVQGGRYPRSTDPSRDGHRARGDPSDASARNALVLQRLNRRARAAGRSRIGHVVRRVPLLLNGTPSSAGEYNWGGLHGTSFWMDAEEDLIGIFMAQIYPNQDIDFLGQFKDLVTRRL